LRTSEDIASWQIRRGILTRDKLAAMRFDVEEIDLLAGRVVGPGPVDGAALDASNKYLAQFPSPPGQTGHCELDVERIMAEGIDGVRAHISKLMADSVGETSDTYESFLCALDGLSIMIANAADAARTAGRTEIEDSCRRVAHHAPVSFRDAIELLWFVTLGVMHGDDVGLVVPGHLDRTLAPFYERDVAAGLLARDEALALVAALYLLVNDYIPDGLAMSVMVGGRDARGGDVTNDVSYLCLEALGLTRLIYPTVGVCWHEGTPVALTELAVSLITQGCATPAFFGDETIQRGLRSYGVPPEESCRYINSTCVEITPSFSSNVWVASPYFSVCKMLLDEIDASNAKSFAGFVDGYYRRLSRHIREAVDNESQARIERSVFGRKPLQSVFTRDCISRGKDIDDGGARYNWVECSFVGLANLADSLHVICREVFDDKRLTLDELKRMLDGNFAGNEPDRLRFLNGHAKYGQENQAVDSLFARTIEFVRAECGKHAVPPDGSPFVPGAFCWVMHEMLGRECGATPDGRRAGAPFADGCGPAQGRETKGPTAAILSTTSWDHSAMIGGLAFNMKFPRALFDGPKGSESLRHLIVTYLKRGGFETQVNVVDAATLKEARKNPEPYRDLVVRIGGYCDYFTRLSPHMQDEVILRTEYGDV
jgi:formate C-acetyltransferase